MAGIYIHIPFCRKACRYCDFHFTISLSQRSEIIKAIGRELTMRRDYTGENEIRTIYFGGGTPSVLNQDELSYLLSCLNGYPISDEVEISFEANPDDLTEDYLKMLFCLGINRLSIGIQSFYEEDLALMRRSHSVRQAYEAIENACMIGFGNVNIDLIYGFPGMDSAKWEKNLKIVMGFNIAHLSAYHLSYEPGTIFDHWRKKGKLLPVQEEESLEQFGLLRKITRENGYEHYEISNFAKEGYISQHNTNYWRQVPYIGAGPSAHSYDGRSRRWNLSSNSKYCDNLMKDAMYYEEEELSDKDLYNEYIMTSLRTIWGIDPTYIIHTFGESRYEYFKDKISRFIDNETVEMKSDTYTLTEKGIFLADNIIADLFI